MSTNMLISNDEKTEIVHFSSKFMGFEKLDGLSVGNSFVKCRSSVRDLGVYLDNEATMTRQVSEICKSASYSLWKIGRIRQYLDKKSAEKLIHAFVTS